MCRVTSGVPILVKACDSCHIEMVHHLIHVSGLKDLEGPDGLNALTLAIGQLNPDLVKMLASPKVQTKTPEFLCNIMEELDREISGEKSDSKKSKMKSVRSIIVDLKIHEKFCKRLTCGRKHSPIVEEM